MLQHKLAGVGVAMITPFTAEGRVDYEALARMIDYVIEGGVDYIVALGTTAETPTLYTSRRCFSRRPFVCFRGSTAPCMCGKLENCIR